LKGKILSLAIMVLMVLGSFGAFGTNSKAESENECGCSNFYSSEDSGGYTGLSNADIEALQVQGKAEGWTFEVGENPATQYHLDNLCGLVVPDGWEDTAHFGPSEPTGDVGVLSLPSSFDWRDEVGGLPPVKNQGNCGSCWAFATVGPLECNIKIEDGITVDLSEQYLVSCNTDGYGCNGGWWAHDYHQWKEGSKKDGVGAVMEDDFRYVAYKAPCKSCTHAYLIKDWEFVGSEHGTPSVDKIKQAIENYGPVSVAVYANTAMQAYTGGIFNGCGGGQVNHAVVLVGWDDTQGENGVWFMRNSWGTGWGEDGGYMRIPYGCSDIGYSACYIDYKSQPAIGERQLEVEIHKISNHPDDGEFEPIDPLFNQPEWYYRVGVDADSDTIHQYNYHRDPDGWWIFAWYSNYIWTPSEVHHFYINDLNAEVTIKLMDEDLWPNPDDLADVSEYPNGGEKDGADKENRGAIYHGTYDLKTNSLTGDNTGGPDDGYYTTIGDGDENAKIWFKIYDPVVADPGGPYYGVENVDIEFEGDALQYSGRSPYSYHWDFGDGGTSNQQNPTHEYSEGDYTATLTVTDDNGDPDKAYADVTVYENTAPEEPSISGPSNGEPRNEYSFTFTATDPEGGYGDKVSYCIDWDDGSSLEWTDFVSSGTGVTRQHTWSSRNQFTIKAKTKDLNGAESGWATKSFSTPKNKPYINTPFMQFLQQHPLIYQLLQRFLLL